MQISELTGLPELPDGYFWRIEERRRSFDIFSIDATGAFIAIMQEIKIDRVVDTPHRFWFLEWTWGNHVETEIEIKTFVKMPFVTKETYDVVVYDENDNRVGVRPTEREVRLWSDDLTEEIILEHAERLFEKFHITTKARSFLGDYPPKHLSRPEATTTEGNQ